MYWPNYKERRGDCVAPLRVEQQLGKSIFGRPRKATKTLPRRKRDTADESPQSKRGDELESAGDQKQAG